MDTKCPSAPSWLLVMIIICIPFLLFSASTSAVASRRKLDDIAGSIDIDCGLPEGGSYIDQSTDIPYISDEPFIKTGVNEEISPVYNSNQPTWLRTVRSFAEGNRNCYSLRPPEGRDKIYLIRASFMYGNYDNQNRLPVFELYLGVNLWSSLKFDNASHVLNMEIIHVPSLDHLDICLVNTGFGTPFISALEVRHFHNSTYTPPNQTDSLVLFQRLDFGSFTNDIIRYNDDAYDRIWYPYNCDNCGEINTNLTTDSVNRTNFNLPPKVMMTASRPVDVDAESLSFELDTGEATVDLSIYMHFAELEILGEGESRVFDILLNGIALERNVAPSYLQSITVTSPQPVRGSKLNILLSKSRNSSHPPILNALEIYIVSPFWQSPTDQGDVDAIEDIKSAYGVKKGWQGDPCAPIHPWNGLNCSKNGYRPYRIISINLSSSGLREQIPVSLSNLEMLEHIDLSNNSISGEVPEFLTQLAHLRTLNLQGNSLSGKVPSGLTERSNNGSLILSLDGNPHLCIQPPCKKEKSRVVVPVVATIVPLLAIFIVLLIVWIYKRNNDKQGRKTQREGSGIKLDSREFTHLEIIRITDNFRSVAGKGGFGTVYHGYLDDGIEVAVKMLSPSATDGSAQFQTEAQLLTRIHHKNLASFIGYCNDGTTLAILYEYMAGGNLEKHLLDPSKPVLSWKERLQIALDAGQGLEYLHLGCKPPIIHRDVKCSNILLNEKMQAKIADFGLSKLFPVETKSHLSTSVVGTVGYLDPEYYTSNRLTEKSDVYSFGIVLLELITGRPAITVGHNDNTHIAVWARPLIAAGDLRNLVDPRLVGNFDTNSAWKFLEIAISCIRSISIQRPSMNHVVAELKECLETEIANEETQKWDQGNLDDGPYSIEINSTKAFEVGGQGPQAR
ncbi:Putative leucine-rich repeat receptor-like protein kinase At2g19210 [Linum grandiflorum]